MPRIERKCYFCDATTKSPMTDFGDIGWSAFQIGRMVSICFCPIHKDQMMKAFDEEWNKHYEKTPTGVN